MRTQPGEQFIEPLVRDTAWFPLNRFGSVPARTLPPVWLAWDCDAHAPGANAALTRTGSPAGPSPPPGETHRNPAGHVPNAPASLPRTCGPAGSYPSPDSLTVAPPPPVPPRHRRCCANAAAPVCPSAGSSTRSPALRPPWPDPTRPAPPTRTETTATTPAHTNAATLRAHRPATRGQIPQELGNRNHHRTGWITQLPRLPQLLGLHQRPAGGHHQPSQIPGLLLGHDHSAAL